MKDFYHTFCTCILASDIKGGDVIINFFIVKRVGENVPKDIYQPSNTLFTERNIKEESKNLYGFIFYTCSSVDYRRFENMDFF